MKNYTSPAGETSNLLERLARWRRRAAQKRRVARELAMLNALNEHILNDIGVRRTPSERLRQD